MLLPVEPFETFEVEVEIVPAPLGASSAIGFELTL